MSTKGVFLFSLPIYNKTFFILRKTEPNMIKNVQGDTKKGELL